MLLALWDYIDNKARKRKDRHSINLMKQAFFVALCVGCCVLIDQYFLDLIIESVLMNLVTRNLMLILLLPLILVVASVVAGPSKTIMISDSAKLKK
jgi:ABC-type bacteriocin/lantibiotic exporter with double-glycine peptidase domain